MNTAVIEEYMWTDKEKEYLPQRYGCQLILTNVSEEEAKNPSFPKDAYNVYYYDGNKKLCLDVCRGTKVKIFDLYYDKFGPGSLVKIDWGYGKVNPKLWGSQNKKEKKKGR